MLRLESLEGGTPELTLTAAATGGALCDLIINCASVASTEMATLLCVRQGGTAIFFSTASPEKRNVPRIVRRRVCPSSGAARSSSSRTVEDGVSASS